MAKIMATLARRLVFVCQTARELVADIAGRACKFTCKALRSSFEGAGSIAEGLSVQVDYIYTYDYFVGKPVSPVSRKILNKEIFNKNI
jgi:hypothetical protein